MPAVRPRSALAVVAGTVGLLVTGALLAAPAVAESHQGGHGNGRPPASHHVAKHHGAGGHHQHGTSPAAAGAPGPVAYALVAQPATAVRHNVATVAVAGNGKQGTGQGTNHGRGHGAKAVKTHGRHATAVTTPGGTNGQRPAVQTRPTTPVFNPVSPTNPVIALRGRAAERVAITNRTVGESKPPAVVGDGGTRVAPPLEQLVLRIGDAARLSPFGGLIGWMMTGVLLLAVLMMGAAIAVGRRRLSSGTAG